MLRYLHLLCLSVLLYDATARPFTSWEKEINKAAQDTRYDDWNEKMMLGIKEVEPLEDLDLTEVDTDPGMLLQKAFKQLRQQRYNKPEEDKDETYHPFESLNPVVNEQPDTYIESQHGQPHLYQEPEKDLDDLYHNTQDLVEPKEHPELFESEEAALKEAEVVQPDRMHIYTSPEEDKDSLYHGDVTGQEFEPEDPVMQGLSNQPRMVYEEPEEDLDSLFHS
ncbi:uncharacterized protein si:ch211-217g15.3 [Trichomycterus rosablanca]|uniref:uncharacterized protein si:ch211-217g15.3 n=1 Tax=Trichomycterus rosablanca TaxID=2290929 RepID=UPI002F353070